MNLLSLVSRACLVCLFPPSAFDKIMHRQQALDQARSGPLPDPRLLIDAGTVIETVAPLCIVTGRFDRPAAFVLAGFCAVTALGYHRFWTFDDLRAPGKSKGREAMWEFLKNFGLVGGLLTVAFPRATTEISRTVFVDGRYQAGDTLYGTTSCLERVMMAASPWRLARLK